MYHGLSDFYTSDDWTSFRNLIILDRLNESAETISEYSGKPIVNKYDIILHHKIPLTEDNVHDAEVALNPDNVMIVSHQEHNIIHNRFGIWQRHIYLVWGSPCSGKTTFVLGRAGADDIIIDVDRLYEAINTTRSNRLYNNVMQLYRQLIDTVRTRNGKWVNAWVIRATCIPSELERLGKDIGAEYIHVDTDRMTCLERAMERAEYYPALVETYFEKYSIYRNLLEGGILG